MSRCWIIPVPVVLHMQMVAEESMPILRPHSSPKSVIKHCTASPSDAPFTRAGSSGSALDKTTVYVLMTWRPRKTAPSQVELWVWTHPAQSLSVYTNISLGAARHPKWTTARRPGKYQASRLGVSASRWVGDAMLRHSSFTANAISGRSLARKFARAASARKLVAAGPSSASGSVSSSLAAFCLGSSVGASRIPSQRPPSRARRGFGQLPPRKHLPSSGRRG